MSTRTQSTEPWRTARIFAVSLAAYFVVHVCGSSLSDVPTAAEFASIDSKGQVELGDLEQFEWYLSTSQLEAFDSVAVLARNRELLELEGSARTQITTYSKSTQNSNPEVVARLAGNLEAGEFTLARATWQEVQEATSSRTLAAFGRNTLETDLAGLEAAQRTQRAAVTSLEPAVASGFLWTSPAGAKYEVLALAALAAIASLFMRRRSLLAKGYETDPSLKSLGYAAGPLAALILWSLLRPGLDFASYGSALLGIGIGFGFGVPYLARGIARLMGKDPNRGQRLALSTVRKSRIVAAMHDLRPTSFADLKRAASQFAAELVSAEVEDHPQS